MHGRLKHAFNLHRRVLRSRNRRRSREGGVLADKQGLKVVSLDARDRPVEAARQAKYPGDILVNAAKTPVEEVLEQIKTLREPGYDRGAGVDGASLTCPLSMVHGHTLSCADQPYRQCRAD